MNESLALILVMLVAGYLSARTSIFPDNAADTLQRFVIYVCLPALVLSIVPALRWSSDLFVVALTPWLLLALGVVLVLVGARVMGWSRDVKGALLLCVPIGNTSFLGFPMLEAYVGHDAIRLGVIYDQLGSFMILATYGLIVVASCRGEAAPTPSIVLSRVLRFPPFIALCVGLMIPHARGVWPDLWPVAAQSIVARVGATLIPVAMFAVGLKLQLKPSRSLSPLVYGLAAKMVVLPLSAWVVAYALGVTGTPAAVIVLESGMPSSVSAGALAMMAGLAPELAAALVGYGILLSFVTLPLLYALT